jgi:hypothetical protein
MRGISIGSNFPPYDSTWSVDARTLTLTRKDLTTRLAAGFTYTLILNGVGYESMTDTQGNLLPETVISFTTVADYDYELLKIPADTDSGFAWPYYLGIPDGLSSETTLLVEPNNTGTVSDDLDLHDEKALELARARADFAVGLDVPLLVPTFPRPASLPGIYTHALDRYSLTTDALVDGNSIERVDLQLIAMIRDAQQRLADRGFGVSDKIFMMGFSASGAFTSRFTMLHPEIVQAAAPGSPGGWPLAPVTAWEGTTLRYPVGIADVADLVGVPVDLAAFRRVPQYIYVGDLDQNDALDLRDFPQDEVDYICALLDCRPAPYISDRWPIAEAMYEAASVSDEFVVYPGVAHTISMEMFADVRAFFERHRDPRTPGRVDLIPLIGPLLLE